MRLGPRFCVVISLAVGAGSYLSGATVASAGERGASSPWRPSSGQPWRMAQAGAAPKSSSIKSLIDKASEMFEDQSYEESLQTLSGALVRPGATKAQRIEVYRLLAFNHIALGHNEEADAGVRALLVLDESFALPAGVSPKFRDFFEKAKKSWEDEGKPGVETAGAPPDPAKPISVKHAPPAQAEIASTIKVEGTIDDPGARVAKVELYYRAGVEGKFIEKDLVYAMGAFRGQIPPDSVAPPLVEYYVLALDAAGLPIASRGDADAPLRVTVAEEGTSVVESPWFWIPLGVGVVGGAILTAVLVTQLGSESTVRINVTE